MGLPSGGRPADRKLLVFQQVVVSLLHQLVDVLQDALLRAAIHALQAAWAALCGRHPRIMAQVADAVRHVRAPQRLACARQKHLSGPDAVVPGIVQ